MAVTVVRAAQLKDGDITDVDIAAANKDGIAGTPSMRTLGTGAQQAAAGDHTHSGTGDIIGPGSSTDNAIPRFDGTTGKLLQNSGVTIDDSDNMSLPNLLNINGASVSPSIKLFMAAAFS